MDLILSQELEETFSYLFNITKLLNMRPMTLLWLTWLWKELAANMSRGKLSIEAKKIMNEAAVKTSTPKGDLEKLSLNFTESFTVLCWEEITLKYLNGLF